MITFSKLGNHGRLANQLFQIAAMIGFSNKHDQQLVLPKWKYAPNFVGPFPEGEIKGEVKNNNERSFHYENTLICEEIKINRNHCYDYLGYFQSEKYFDKVLPIIKKTFTFNAQLISQIKRKYYAAFNKKTICIHVRRGDYVDNPNYELLPINYFITALFEHFPNWQEYNLVICSDDIAYCKVHFDCINNVFFADGNELEDLALASLCDNFILSNSSYSWWMAWLGEKKGSKIVRPTHHFNGNLKATCDIKDFWPDRWIEYDHRPGGVAKLIDLSDVTFTIPVAFDHPDRKQNLDLCVCMLQHHFITNIIIGEQGSTKFEYMKEHCTYIQFQTMVWFHRTKMLNDMARFAETPIVANWDADVMVSPLQLWATVDKIRNGADVCYPYKWAFARIPRKPWFKEFERRMDIGIVGDTKFNGMNNGDVTSVGGAVLFNKKSFFEGGGENENFISFGPEDAEREYRFRKLSYLIERTLGPIYHINHWVGNNSSNRHPHVNQNRNEWQKISTMTINQLQQYVKTWKWSQK